MEVIPLDDRVRSTTVLNTAAPSDFTTVYNDDNYDDAPDAFNDQLAADDLAADAANEGMWTRRNKLLLSLIAGSALLCAIATGSGVAAHRARVANLNSCPVGMMPVGATSPSPGPPASAKSSKSPTAKSSKSTSGPVTTTRALTGATVPATVEDEEEVTGGAYYPEVPKTVEDKRKNRMLAEHLGQRDASSTLSWKLKNALGEVMPKLNFGSDEEEQHERRLQATRAPTKSSKSPSAKGSKSPTAKSSKSSSGLVGGIVDGLKPSDNCKCVNSGLNSSSGSGGGGGGKSSKSPSTKSSKSPSTKSSKSPSTKSSKSPSTKSSKSPSTKSSKSPTAGLVGGSPLAPITCNVPVPVRPTTPMAPGSKSSKSPTSKTGKSTRVPASTKTPLGTTPIAPVTPPGNVVKPPAPPATKPPTASVIPPPATPAPTPCTVDCPGVPVADPTPTPPTPGGGGGENPSVPKPPPTPTPGTGELTPPVPTPPTPGTEDLKPPAPTPPTPGTPIDVPVGFPTRFPKLDSYGPTPETTVGVTVTVGEEDKTPPTFSPSRVVGVNTPMPTNLGTSIGTSVGSSGGTITVSTETTGPPTLAIRDDEDEQGDDEESVR